LVNSRGGDKQNLALKSWVRALEKTAPIERTPFVTLPALMGRLADSFEDEPALVSPEATLSYRALAALSNRYSRWAIGEGIAPGDVVCLLMPNCAEYVAVWLGITRIGATVALLNTNLLGDVLAHSINIVSPKHIIAAADLAPALVSARSRLSPAVVCWVHGPSSEGFKPLIPELGRLAGDSLSDSEYTAPSIDTRALYIYTSGTTGLPKAANVSHFRLMQWSHWFAGMMDTRPEDRMYNCLPLYHGVGGIVATGATLVGGGAVVLRPRFSASEFWRDVIEERCTLFQYIGELCRYLVRNATEEQDTQHSVRLACGNGLGPEVWEEFQRRFRIPRILEYYASTEGNFSLYNCESQPGSIGRIPPFLAHRLPVRLVRFDPVSGEPLRNSSGFCERCQPNEVGEAIAPIATQGSTRSGAFEGYADPAATARKILRDVFESGDAWYRAGDLMRCDERGFYFFVDRVGETFRWKGENVSTTEVREALLTCRGVVDAVVYGVAVPGADGRAGMAALVVSEGFEFAVLREELTTRLPAYARPVFLRILPVLESTGTLRPKRQELVEEGFDLSRVGNPVYVDDRGRDAYVELDSLLYARIVAAGLQL
jgi:fatty-acyl-CoA synthase